MTAKELLKIMSDVDDDLVAELEEARQARVTRIRPQFYIGLAGAMCAVLLAIFGIKNISKILFTPETSSVDQSSEDVLTEEMTRKVVQEGGMTEIVYNDCEHTDYVAGVKVMYLTMDEYEAMSLNDTAVSLSASIDPDKPSAERPQWLEQRISVLLKYWNGSYPDYYGGAFNDGKDMYILLTSDDPENMDEIRNLLDDKDLYFVKAKRSYNDLIKTFFELDDCRSSLNRNDDKIADKIKAVVIDVERNNVFLEVIDASTEELEEITNRFSMCGEFTILNLEKDPHPATSAD